MQHLNRPSFTTFVFAISIGSLVACNGYPPEQPPKKQQHQTQTEPNGQGGQAIARHDDDLALVNPATAPERNTRGHVDRSTQPLELKEESEARPSREQFSQPAPVAQGLSRQKRSSADAVSGYLMSPPMPTPYPTEPVNRENYAHHEDNPVKLVAEHPVSTFSIDVDTGSYSNLRRFLKQGQLPPEDAVRIEEMINYFDYAYAAPRDRNTPFGVVTEVAVTPWNADTRLVHVGIQGWEPQGEAKPANLVFLIDVSGSMHSQDKLPLLKNAMKMLTRQMDSRDRISMVVYAGASGVVLEPTPGDQHGKISAALDQLRSGGSTNGAAGISQAYAMAEEGFIKGGINRVILCTDGDFNVGTTNFEQLVDMVERKRESGISITTLGFGSGNYNEHLMEQLADKGNGNYGYIDSLNEAQKLLVDGLRGTLETIAKDVKIQIEFNPNVVAEYRLIGYENRMLKREDFNNDKIDAGEIGAGHSVTALYEVALVDGNGLLNDPLRYGKTPPEHKTGSGNHTELAFLRLRYKAPNSDRSKLIERPIQRSDQNPRIAQSSESFRFAAAVAAFGQRMRGGKYTGQFDYDAIRELASNARGSDRYGYRGEFLQLVSLAQSLDHSASKGQQDTAHRGTAAKQPHRY